MVDNHLKHKDQLLLTQPILRSSLEQSYKAYRLAHRHIDRDASVLLNQPSRLSEPPLETFDTLISQALALREKLVPTVASAATAKARFEKGLEHVDQLYAVQDIQDESFKVWGRQRVNMLVVDYLAQSGRTSSAEVLAERTGVRDLVDIEHYQAWNIIYAGLNKGDVAPALSWCAENRKELRKSDSPLEFQLRLQQYIELLRSQTPTSLTAAIIHYRKHLHPHRQTHPLLTKQAVALPALSPTSLSPLFSPTRWKTLNDLFTSSFRALHNLPTTAPLIATLRTGISALKTPACQVSNPSSTPIMITDLPIPIPPPGSDPDSSIASELITELTPAGIQNMIAASSNALQIPMGDIRDPTDTATSDDSHPMDTTRDPSEEASESAALVVEELDREKLPVVPAPACPVCSPELNALAGNLPYACHTRSCMGSDMVRLPSGNAYSRQALIDYAETAGIKEDAWMDFKTGRVYRRSDHQRVYIP